MLGFAVGPDAREAFLPYGHEVRVGLALFGREARGRVLAAGRDERGDDGVRAPLVLCTASMAYAAAPVQGASCSAAAPVQSVVLRRRAEQ